MSNEPSIGQMNETIGVFMGGFWREFKAGNFRQKRFYYKDEAFAWVKSPENLNYHKEWNELMPVIEKIESLENRRFGVCIDVLDTMVMDYKVPFDVGEKIIVQTDIYPDNGDTKISITHHAVYQFIIWYNQQTTTNGNENV